MPCLLTASSGRHLERCAWWRHQMEPFSALLSICAGNSPVPGEIPTERPVTRSFNVFFDLRQNKRLSKQSWGWWLETLSRPLWSDCNDSSCFHMMTSSCSGDITIQSDTIYNGFNQAKKWENWFLFDIYSQILDVNTKFHVLSSIIIHIYTVCICLDLYISYFLFHWMSGRWIEPKNLADGIPVVIMICD